MIECIFSLDYEVYGNGEGSLAELVYDPTARLTDVFTKVGGRFVPFVEVAELEIIEAARTDPAINLVRQQVRQLHDTGFTPGLHLHPQWYNALHRSGRWYLDYSEYNLCKLSAERVVCIVDRALSYFRDVVGTDTFTPLSFRAGNWLFQPTTTVAAILHRHGVRIDSSVFKGGLRHEHNLDYRRALNNGYFWRFTEHVDIPELDGALLEMPIFTQMVPFWKMSSTKRLRLERQNLVAGNHRKRLNRMRDLARIWHPLKFDFCRMSSEEMRKVIETVMKDDRKTPSVLKPIVAIGHTKELVDFAAIERFLVYLKSTGVSVSTFDEAYARYA
jgi:hypothetical protein